MGFASDLRARGEQLTLEQLGNIARVLATKRLPGGSSEDFVRYGLATEILRYFLGDKWTNDCVFSVHHDVAKEHKDARAFLETDGKLLEEKLRHQQRVVELAEILFNLKSTPGFDSRVDLLRSRNLQSALAEFECAAILAKPGLSIRFIEEQGVKGLDYEAEVTTSSGASVRCEVKARVADSALNSESLWRTLDQARKQLPKESGGIVLVRLPEEWGFPETVVDDASRKLFRQSKRVAAVIVVTEHWAQTPAGKHLVFGALHLRRNSAVPSAAVDEVCQAVERPRQPPWVSLAALALHAEQQFFCRQATSGQLPFQPIEMTWTRFVP